jgi:hypothetical protein
MHINNRRMRGGGGLGINKNQRIWGSSLHSMKFK